MMFRVTDPYYINIAQAEQLLLYSKKLKIFPFQEFDSDELQTRKLQYDRVSKW